jgi:hypothetical protein
MDVICNQCQGEFKIADDKLPVNQISYTPCPRCKNALILDNRTQSSSLSYNNGTYETICLSQMEENNPIKTVSSSPYDAAEKPFDFLESGTKTALICEEDPVIMPKMRSVIGKMGFHAVEPAGATDALKKMRFHVFDLLILNESYDCPSPDDNPILTYMNDLIMSVRRNMFVALITSRFRTMDNMAAFNKSVNIVIHLKNIDEISGILNRAIDENQTFYKIFKESLEITGRV